MQTDTMDMSALTTSIGSDDPVIGLRAVLALRRLAEQDRRDPDELTVALSGAITVTREPAPADRSPLTGTPEQIAESVRHYADAGLQHLAANVRMDGDISLAATLDAMMMLAEQVLPAAHDA